MKCFARHIFRLASLCVVVLTMVGSLSSCRRYAGDETAVGSALAVADSLRYDAPAATDSIIRSLDADSLGSRANAALYSVLANEVNLYGDQVAVADSIADIAVDYYRLRRWFSKRNRYLYARALMQKATILNQLDSNELAIRTLSDAEKALSDNDYELLGDVCLLKGKMYADNNSKLHEYIAFYHNAYNNYSLSSNIAKGAEMLSEIGAAYRTHNLDSSLFYLNKSDSIAREHNLEGLQIKNLAFLSSTYKINKDYRKAITTALNAISSEELQTEELKETYYVICDSYLKLGMVDSALYYLEKGNFDTIQPKENLTRIIILRKASRISGDYKTAYELSGKEQSQIIQILNDSREKNISTYERKYRIEKLEWKNAMMTVLMLAIVIVMVCIMLYRRSLIKRKQLQHELLVAELQQSITMLQQKHSAGFMPEECNATTDADVSRTRFNEVYRRYLEVFGKIRELTTYISKDGQNLNIIKTMVSSLSEDKELSHNFIGEVRAYVNAHHNNILEHLRSLHPSLKEDDIDLLALMLAGYNTSMIVICMGYTDRASLNNKRSRLKKRLGIDVSISAYLQQLIESTQKQG